MGGFLGALSHASPRASYPLGFHHAARVTDTRLVLVGDAVEYPFTFFEVRANIVRVGDALPAFEQFDDNTTRKYISL